MIIQTEPKSSFQSFRHTYSHIRKIAYDTHDKMTDQTDSNLSDYDKKGSKSPDAFREFPLRGALSPFGRPYKAYYHISDSVPSNILDPKSRILLHLVCLTVLSAAHQRLPECPVDTNIRKCIEAAIVERCALREIEDALLHAKYVLNSELFSK